jgi:Uma2 family endonuclease
MSTVQTGRMTAEEFWDWCNRPENADRRVELDRGEIVDVSSPGERHGFLCLWIGHLLWEYIARRGHGTAIGNDTVRGPNVMFFEETISFEELNPRHSTRLPALIVEVISPSDSFTWVNLRVTQYQRRGVPLVWLVDPDTRTVTVCRPGEINQVLEDTEELVGVGATADLRIPIARLFDRPGQAPSA